MAVLTPEQKKLAYRLRAKGLSLAEVARQAGCSAPSVTRIERGRPLGEEVPDSWTPRAGHLTIGDREQILLGMARGDSFSRIARGIGRAPSTVTREVANNGGQDSYQAWAAHQRAHEQARRPKSFLLAEGALLTEVTQRLTELWSPREISARLRTDFPDDEAMRVSHETIYQSLFVQGRGELRRELARYLRSGRTARRSQGRVQTRGKIGDMVLISERPAEVEDRAVPGHWEGDLIMGAGNRSAVGTLVERTRGVRPAVAPGRRQERCGG